MSTATSAHPMRAGALLTAGAVLAAAAIPMAVAPPPEVPTLPTVSADVALTEFGGNFSAFVAQELANFGGLVNLYVLAVQGAFVGITDNLNALVGDLANLDLSGAAVSALGLVEAPAFTVLDVGVATLNSGVDIAVEPLDYLLGFL